MKSAPVPPASARTPAPRPTTQMVIGCVVIPIILAAAGLGIFFYVRANASTRLTVPQNRVILVRAAPDESAPLLARFGQGKSLPITGRSADWRWLELELWQGQRGWTLRPLDTLVWQLDAPLATPQPPPSLPPVPTPVPPTMIPVPATTFTMGSPPGLGEADEQPAHPVSISAFSIDRTEVTVGQYWACVAAGACAAPAHHSSQTEPHYLNDPSFDNYPIINVSWTQANRYCSWRGKRLPTEAEWELVAGWDTGRNAKLQWPWGSNPTLGRANLAESSAGGPVPVDQFGADQSPLGALNMAGNVSEWVFDWYKVDYYSNADDSDPTGPSHRRGEGSGRVVRGGSFADSPEQGRTSNRRHQDAEYGYATVGFRCAKDGP